MSLLRLLKKSTTLLTTLILTLVISNTAASAQTPAASVQDDTEREQAIRLYETGDAGGAVKALQALVKKQKNDVRAWHYLGLALAAQGNSKDAVKAHEKAAKAVLELISKQLRTEDIEQIPATLALFKPRLEEAVDSADKYLKLSSKPTKEMVIEWQDRAQNLRDLIKAGQEIDKEQAKGTIFDTKELTTKARILQKAFPLYPEEARLKRVSGTVVLLLILSADGQVRGFIPLVPLPYGLTDVSIIAARQIRFNPAMKDGKPVSQFIRVEYSFNIH